MATEKKNIAKEELEACIKTLQALVHDSQPLVELTEEQRVALMKAAGEVSRPDRTELRKRRKDLKNKEKAVVRQQDRAAREATGDRKSVV